MYSGMIDEMSIQLPETCMNELFEIYPKDKIIEKSFIESLRWRKIESITPRIVQIVIDKFDNGDRDLQQNIFETLLVLSFSPKHPLNILSIHQKLLDMSMLQRDYVWSLPIHNLFTEDKIVKRVINWAWDKKEKFEIEDKSLYLYGLTLGWFLTSSNRELRDGATKAVVNLFTDKVDIFLGVLQSFETVNDLYVLERLYAVSYGIVLRSRNQDGFRELGEYIYESIFYQGEVIEHILLRDYAKLSVEYIDNIVSLDIETQKVLPPYGSSIPSSYPDYDEIESYGNKSSALSTIVSSMRTEKMGWYGDFGRYTFQAALMSFNDEDFDIQSLSNYAVKIIHDEYIDDIELFDKTEEMMEDISYERHIHKVERVGKKYQWLAMYKMLAKVADNYQVRGDGYDNYTDYGSTSQLYIRNIDPTTILKEKTTTDKLCWYVIHDNEFENPDLEDNEAWLQSNEKLPLMKNVVNPTTKDEYLILDSYLTKSGEKDTNQYRYLMYDIHSYIVKKEEFGDILEWIKKHNFYQEPIEDVDNFDEDYLRAYPNNMNDDYWSRTCRHRIHSFEQKISHKILLTSVSYRNDGQSYDQSVSNYINIALPVKWLINKMKLKQSLTDGEWIDENQQVVFFDPTVKMCSDVSNEGVLVANKKLFFNWLNANDYTILWVLTGEKDLRNSDSSKYEDAPFIGRGGISGYAYFEGDKFIEHIDIKIERSMGWVDD
jgi:hypothetical protein